MYGSDTASSDDDYSDGGASHSDNENRFGSPALAPESDELRIEKPDFVGEVVMVEDSSVITFHDSARRALAECLRPVLLPKRCSGGIALTVGDDGVVDMHIFKTKLFFKGGKNKIFAVREEDATLRLIEIPRFSDDEESVTTPWSKELPVYWVIGPGSQFFPRSRLTFKTNQDFQLYDLPDGYMAVMQRGEEDFSTFECEAFSCEVMHASGGERISLCPPIPTRPLQRPTDVGFDPRRRTVDVLSAKQYVKWLLEAYASPSESSMKNGWTDPLGLGGEWDETRGKLMWLLLSLDEDDLLRCVNTKWWETASEEVNDVEFPDIYTFRLVVLLLNAPWFLTANALDAMKGKCVPFGATVGGDNAWWDQSPSKWKSKLGMRAFEGSHALSKTYECSSKCDMVSLLKRKHDENDKMMSIHKKEDHVTEGWHVSIDHVKYCSYVVMKCDSCGKMTKVSDAEFRTDGTEDTVATGVACVCKHQAEGGGVDRTLKYVRFCNRVRCTYPDCSFKNRPVDCDCFSGTPLAERQSRTTKDVFHEVRRDVDEIKRRVEDRRKIKVPVRPALPGEDPKEYKRHKSDRVAETIEANESLPFSLVAVCAEDETMIGVREDGREATFQPVMAEGKYDSYDDSKLPYSKFVTDAYSAMTMNAEWEVIKVTRDAVVAKYATESKVELKFCEECLMGTCEKKKDGKYHCVACRRWRLVKPDKLTFPNKVVADVNVMDANTPDVIGVPLTYSEAGRDIGPEAFLELLLRNMARRFF